jgi:hypothetical protein
MEIHTPGSTERYVATDSLGSMYGIAKMITRPQDLKEHRHRQILEDLATAVRDHPGTVHLWKVKSHTGIIGNELAGGVAVQVARGEQPPDASPSHAYDVPSNSRAKMYWPHKESEKESPNGEIVKIATPLPDIQAALKHEAHAHTKHGSAPRDGVYASSWQNIETKLHHQASHAFMTSSKVDWYTRKLVLQYRWGLLPTNRLLHKIGKTPTNQCPLCGGGGRRPPRHQRLQGAIRRVHTPPQRRRHRDTGGNQSRDRGKPCIPI